MKAAKGEGFDEPWHLGYVQYVAQTGKLPPGPDLHLSVELEQFLDKEKEFTDSDAVGPGRPFRCHALVDAEDLGSLAAGGGSVGQCLRALRSASVRSKPRPFL